MVCEQETRREGRRGKGGGGAHKSLKRLAGFTGNAIGAFAALRSFVCHVRCLFPKLNFSLSGKQ